MCDDYSNWVKLYAAAMAFIGLLSVFAFTGGIRFIENMIRALDPQNTKTSNAKTDILRQRIKGYQICCDFLLDALFWGGMIAIIPLAKVIVTIKPGWAWLYILWFPLLYYLFISWLIKKFRQLHCFGLRRWVSLGFILALIATELVALQWMLSDLSLKSIFQAIFFAKLAYPIIWMFIGLIWSPFSAYVEWIELRDEV